MGNGMIALYGFMFAFGTIGIIAALMPEKDKTK